MPPNKGLISMLDQFKCCYKQAASPYRENRLRYHEECSESCESEGSREDDAPEQLVDDTYRVSTRARHTYELYNYSKNAMMIVTTLQDASVRSGLVTDLTQTFQKFRFEVDVSIASSEGQLYRLCEEFFRRDFTHYGAAALVILAPAGLNQRQSGPPYQSRFFDESVILDNFKLERNDTLANKPKIYITEANRGFHHPEYDKLKDLSLATHGDMIGFHVPAPIDKYVERRCYRENLNPQDALAPLKTFCDKMAAMGDTMTLTKIIQKTANASIKKFPLLNPWVVPSATYIKVINTLSKELYFARAEEDQLNLLNYLYDCILYVTNKS